MARKSRESFLLFGPGADLGFSRGGGDLFFRSTKLILRALLKHKALKRRWPIFCAAGKFLKKEVKKTVFGPFLENFDKKKIAFFLARAPLKVSIYWCRKRL